MTSYIPMPPCAAPGAPSPVKATGRTLNWGIVSTGRIADTVVRDLALLEDARITAVSSRDHARGAEFAARHGIDRNYADDAGAPAYEAMFADPDVEVVYIATPHGQHFEVAKAALEAGKHVLCEKSLTINAAEAEELVRLAGERSLFLMEAIWSRFLPSVHRALSIIRSGELGEVAWVHADLGFPADYDPTWRLWDPAAGGGALLDLGVYPFTWALGTLGFPQSAQAAGFLNDDGVDPQEAITLTYAGGRQAQLMCSLLGAGPREATVSCTAGWLRTGQPLHNPTTLQIHPVGGESRTEHFESIGRDYPYELRETTRCIQEGLTQSPTVSWEHTVQTMRLFDGLRNQLGLRYANDQRR
ncbi:Gfo/Idh/MocA family protein [Zafaria sp. Z1313]|uniref:Gfo/Idh/MocA family protein n=1 Tax=unclassified Zafaria TaxID=2828765 RepID=UPI002E79E845|nr:Gfo/Idh/MocA family oxidoreductase [Zafaria sp. J156]MEE1619860.1 Gfo/Idh/MocA family oxidoreductase [Zafaria sp. J156]